MSGCTTSKTPVSEREREKKGGRKGEREIEKERGRERGATVNLWADYLRQAIYSQFSRDSLVYSITSSNSKRLMGVVLS